MIDNGERLAARESTRWRSCLLLRRRRRRRPSERERGRCRRRLATRSFAIPSRSRRRRRRRPSERERGRCRRRLATRSFAPPPTATRREADATFSSEETDSFYIGLGEDGFCPSASVHESDISESDVEAESTEDEFEESEDGEGEGRDEVNVSILAEYGAVDEAADDGARRGLDTSILTEIMAEETGDWEDEKKEETACVVAEVEDTNQSNEAMPARSTLSVNEIASSPVPSLPPVPLQTTPLNVEHSEDDDKDFVSSSLKNYLTETEANLATFMISIECMTTTPGRIVNAVQLGMQEEEDLDDSVSMTGLTPLQSRFERIDEAEHRSGVLFHSPPAVNDSVAKPSGWEQRFDEADSEVLGLPSPPEVSEEIGLESDHRGGLLLHSPPVMSQSVSSTKTSGFEKSSSTKHEHTLPQSPLPASLETPLAESNAPTTSSPFEVATTEFSTKSTEVMDQLHKAIETKLYLDSPQQPSHMKKTTQDEPQQFTSQSLSPSVECPSTANARCNSKATSITGVSPRTLSMRRSLAAVAKSQTQICIPKPSPRVNLSQSEKLARLAKQRSVSVARKEKYPSPTKKVTSNSERLARLARPRSVRRERSPSPSKEISHRIIAAAKPPTFLNREIKKSRVKSTEELEAEEMSSVFKVSWWCEQVLS